MDIYLQSQLHNCKALILVSIFIFALEGNLYAHSNRDVRKLVFGAPDYVPKTKAPICLADTVQ